METRGHKKGNSAYPVEPVDSGLAGAVRGVIVEREERSRAGRADDLATLTAGDHPPGTLLGHDERCPDVDLGGETTEKNPSKTLRTKLKCMTATRHCGISGACDEWIMLRFSEEARASVKW